MRGHLIATIRTRRRRQHRMRKKKQTKKKKKKKKKKKRKKSPRHPPNPRPSGHRSTEAPRSQKRRQNWSDPQARQEEVPRSQKRRPWPLRKQVSLKPRGQSLGQRRSMVPTQAPKPKAAPYHQGGRQRRPRSVLRGGPRDVPRASWPNVSIATTANAAFQRPRPVPKPSRAVHLGPAATTQRDMAMIQLGMNLASRR